MVRVSVAWTVLFLLCMGLSAGSALRVEDPQPSTELVVAATDEYVDLHGGRYMIQPSAAPKLAPSPPAVVAFDFAGFTMGLLFGGASSVSISLYQEQVAHPAWCNFPEGFNASLEEVHPPAPTGNGGAGRSFPNLIFSTKDQTQNKHNNYSVNPDPGHTDGLPKEYTLYTGLNPLKTYRVSMVKFTEADGGSPYIHPNFVELHSFALRGDPSVPQGPTLYNGSRTFARRIEFIGDSITNGWCNGCKTPEILQNTTTICSPSLDFIDYETFALSWAHLTCLYFNADCHTVAWSGFGMARNCCGGGVIMPDIYNRTLASVNGSHWNFTQAAEEQQNIEGTVARHTHRRQSHWDPPHAVIINLGTNDFALSNGSRIRAHYKKNYLKLLHQVAHYYGPEVDLFLACGPMTEVYCHAVHEMIEIVRADPWNYKAHFLNQTNILTDDNQCCGHPDIAADAHMADVTVEQMKAVLGWDYR